MCSLLAPRLNVFRRRVLSIQAAHQCQRSPIHFWGIIRTRLPSGQTKLLDYEDIPVPDIGSQEISLWSKDEHLGMIPVKDVIKDHLGPGKMLSLRREPPPKNSPARLEACDYEVRPLQFFNKKKIDRVQSKTDRAKTLYLDAYGSRSHCRNIIDSAYRFLHPETGELDIPVEFHIKAHPRPGLEGLEGLSLFTQGRVDLHPSVILRALPEGSFQIVKPKIDRKGSKALWVVAPKGVQLAAAHLSGSPDEVASIIEKVVIRKKEFVRKLLDAGDLDPVGGQFTKQGQSKRRPLFEVNQIVREIRREEGILKRSGESATSENDEDPTSFTRSL